MNPGRTVTLPTTRGHASDMLLTCSFNPAKSSADLQRVIVPNDIGTPFAPAMTITL